MTKGESSQSPNDVSLAALVSWTPSPRPKLEKRVSSQVFGGDQGRAAALLESAMKERLVRLANGALEPTELGQKQIEAFVPPEMEVEGAELSRLIVRAHITGLTINSVTRTQLKSLKLVRAHFVAKRLFALDVPLAKGAAASIARCAEYVGCEWARNRLTGVEFEELNAGANKKLKQRLFCNAAGINEFDPDAGFVRLISSELLVASTSLSRSDSDWTLFRAMLDMGARRTDTLVRDDASDDEALSLVADAISSVTARTLSKWALVADVFRALPGGAFRDLVTLKQSLIDLVEQGSLELSPVVVQSSVSASDREMSELSFGGRQFHFVRIRRS